MRLPRIRGLISLLLVAAASYWLLDGLQQVFGEPFSGDRVLISAPSDAAFIYRDGQAEAMKGTVRAGQHSGWWPVTYGLPLGFLVLMSLGSVWRKMFPKRYAIA